MFSLFTAGLALMVPFTAAYTKPTGDAPVGNPISQPGLNSVVPAGKDFTITWQPTTKGSVTLVLLKGPSSNAVPQYPIVEATENDGVYIWHVADDLEPTDNAQGYGIQLIDDATGQYQYTTQFGISNPSYKKGSESSSSAKAPTYGSSSTASAPVYGSSSSATKSAPSYGGKTTEAPKYTTQYVTDYTTYCPEATSFAINNKTYTVTQATTLTIKDCSCTITKPQSTSAPVKTAPGPVVPPKGTGYPVMSSPAKNVTMVAPTGYSPSTLSTASSVPTYKSPSQPSTTGPNAAASTGGAATNMVGFGGLLLAAGAAVLAL